MDKYKEYLAANVLNEGKPVDFRLLSRAMKVHVNLAKQMLYEFHRSQNARKSGSVHAIYYLEGTKALASPQTNGVHEKDGDDSVMQSSPFMSSMQGPEQVDEAEDIVRRSSVLAQESDVETAQEQFEVIDTIYVYALASGSLKDLSILGDCSRRIAAEFGAEDPLQAWKTYGVVQNTGVKRRTGKRPPTGPPQVPQVATPASKPTAATKPQPEKPKASASAAKNGVTEGTAVRTAAGAHAAPVSDLSTSKPDAPTLKREKSDIFKSFAKTKPKSKQDSQSESQLKDEPMQSDDEEAEDLVPLSNAVADEAHRKARAERAEKLKKMMEEDDEEMADAPPIEKESPAEEEEVAAPIDKAAPAPAEEKEAFVEVTGGRRRGRRRVMKKKTMKDEKGYLVTKEEPAWESFSEDEPAPAPKKTKLPTVAAPTKGKKSQKGQGNLMNFFAKK